MSEYQYFEFLAVDRPLTAEQQAELRSFSSRAQITASSFVNEYRWGDLKGDPLDWMRRYFDAHVFSASWGSCRLMLRLPRVTLEEPALSDFTAAKSHANGFPRRGAFEATATPEHWILHWSLDDESGEVERFWGPGDGPDWMTALLPLRDEILRGDTRPLYLGWLARLSNDELSPEDAEPPLPAGLQSLTPAQTALAEFLLIDSDWLAAAAEASAPAPDAGDDSRRLDTWLATLAPEAMRETLRLLLSGRSREAEHGLRHRYLSWERAQAPQAGEQPSRRTVAEIDARREAAEATRLEREQRLREAAEALRRAERAAFLSSLLAEGEAPWTAIEESLQRGSSAAYDRALSGLKDLVEAHAMAGREAGFRRHLTQLMARHGKRRGWINRLTEAGISWEHDT